MSPAELNHILNALSNKDITHTHPRPDCVDTHHPGAYYPPVRTICVFWYNHWYLRTIHRCVLYPAKYGNICFQTKKLMCCNKDHAQLFLKSWWMYSNFVDRTYNLIYEIVLTHVTCVRQNLNRTSSASLLLQIKFHDATWCAMAPEIDIL